MSLDNEGNKGEERTDQQAGICILYEAGGAAFGAKTKPLSGEVDADLLGKYCCINMLDAFHTDLQLGGNTSLSGVLRVPRQVVLCMDARVWADDVV